MLRFKFVLSLIVLILSGCGFTPLYQHTLDSAGAANIKITLIANREGQILRNFLLDRLNPYGQPKVVDYVLKVTYTIDKSELGFRRDATPMRTNFQVKVSFTLTNNIDNKIVYQDSVDVNTGFSMGAQSATASLPQVVSEQDAVKRTMEQAACEIQLLITSFLHAHKRQL